jgi:predicted transposase YbfD/YdcC
MEKTSSIERHFDKLTDPRDKWKTGHSLIDIITLTICAVISGADDWVSIEDYGEKKEKWLKTFLLLPNGIPSHDTLSRVFSMLSPVEFQQCFFEWLQDIKEITQDDVIAIDGKTLRRSHDKKLGKKAIHIVNAWSKENKMFLGQLKTSEKSNEITAIPALLKILDVKGSTVTIDAMGCQTKIAKEIVKQGADYVLALKDNQKDLHENVKVYFDEVKENPKNTEHQFEETFDRGHGRIEIRRHYISNQIDWLPNKKRWENLNMIGMVESERCIDGEISIQKRYYLSSLTCDAKKFGECVRDHWQVENCLHWVLDVAFREDDSRTRIGNSAENLSWVRKMALNLLKKEKTSKVGVKNKRLSAAWNNDYLLKVIHGSE